MQVKIMLLTVKKWILSLLRKDKLKPRKVLCVFASRAPKAYKATIKNQMLESVIRNTFDVSEIDEILCYPQTNELANNLNCRFNNMDIVTTIKLKESFSRPNVDVLICWNGGINDRVVPIITILIWMRKEFYLLKYCGTSHSMEYIDDGGDYSKQNIKALSKKVFAILKDRKLKYSSHIATSGSIYIKLNDKALKIRISDHKSKQNDEEYKVFNMGLYAGSDGLISEFRKWFKEETFAR